MELEPITRQEKIIAGQDLTPITRMEKFLKNFGGGGGGGSVPKPLTYDYMPEGYPKKSVQATTLMEEQALAFEIDEYGGFATPPNPIAITKGQTYTVKWDGTEYECVGTDMGQNMVLGNQSIAGEYADTGEPFLYLYNLSKSIGQLITSDTSASHTISVKTSKEIVTPMAEEFLPTGIKELIMSSSTTDSTKKFKITVNDSGTISATEVT